MTTVVPHSGGTLQAVASHPENDLKAAQAIHSTLNLKPKPVPDFDKEVLIPLRQKQAEIKAEEERKAAEAEAARVAAVAEAAARRVYVAPAPVVKPYRAVSYSSSGNTYGYGTCTWYAKNRRPDLPNMLGNGGQWFGNAQAMGLPVGYAARVGAIAEQPGHVAYVESVNGDGTVTISEMNYYGNGGGWNTVSRRTAPASSFRYIY